MRAYAFTHLSLSAGVRGLQAAHAICRLRSAHKSKRALLALWDTWEEHHTTMVYLDGGFSQDLENIYESFSTTATDQTFFTFPIMIAPFYEDRYTLNGACTAVAMIVHPRYYTPGTCARVDPTFNFQDLTTIDASTANTTHLKLIAQNRTEPNPNDIVEPACFADYTQEEADFAKALSKFRLSNLG